MLTLVRYDVDPQQAARLPEVYPRHRAHLDAFALGGELLLIGSLEDPLRNGALGVFTSRAAADRFTAADPFVLEGLARPTVLEWDALEFVARPAGG